jgi:riboflavin synthase
MSPCGKELIMFTGLIERVGTLESIVPRGNGSTARIAAETWDEPLVDGESIAVNGACLTVSRICSPSTFEADILNETLERTSLSSKRPGAGVNLERAMRLNARVGGHMVSGHVDGLGKLGSVKKTGSDYILRVACSGELIMEIIPKGSVSLEGVSLTVSAVGTSWFEVHIIPHTWKETTFGDLREGAPVNIETDLIGKYVRKFASGVSDDASILDRMKRSGFPLTGN